MVKTRSMRKQALKARPVENSLPNFIDLEEENREEALEKSPEKNNGGLSMETDPSEYSNTEVGTPTSVEKPTERHSNMTERMENLNMGSFRKRYDGPLFIRKPMIQRGRKLFQGTRDQKKGKEPAVALSSHEEIKEKSVMSHFDIAKELEAMEKRAIEREEKNKEEIKEMLEAIFKRSVEGFIGAEHQANLQYEHSMLQFMDTQSMQKKLRKRMMSEFVAVHEKMENHAEDILERMLDTDNQIAQIQQFLGNRLGPK